MNDYLTALAAIELTRTRPSSRHQPARKPRRAGRVAALARALTPRRIAVARPAAA